MTLNSPTYFTAIIMAALIMAVLVNKSSDTVRYQANIIDSLKTELDYYHRTYQYREGVTHDQLGRPETIRVVTIDAGRNWILVSDSREVLGSRYLHIAYPDINPDSLNKVY